MTPVRPGVTTRATVWAVDRSLTTREEDSLATEEPLEIRLAVEARRQPVAVTMRTPGADFELAVGFLFAEGVLESRDQLRRVSYCLEDDVDADQRYNIVNVELAPDVPVDLAPLERHFSLTSACGVCGKATIESLRTRLSPPPRSSSSSSGPSSPSSSSGPSAKVSYEVVNSLPDKLKGAQAVFRATGGLHATALFTARGELCAVREDVGRHNAMDKLIGWALLQERIPLAGHVVMVSGRSSFELVQKALAAGVAVLCSVSAPSSMAVDLARAFDLTLVGFVRDGRFKVYSGIERLDVRASRGSD